MPRLRIRNFGPVRDGLKTDDGFIFINQVTLIIGNQATGKSSVAKLYSTFCWLEKSLDGTDYPSVMSMEEFASLLKYHRIDSYLSFASEIDYTGSLFDFSYMKGRLTIKGKESENYIRPKILYVPADRIFCTALQNPDSIKGLARNTFDFLVDYGTAKAAISSSGFRLPVNGFSFRYDENTKKSFVLDEDKNYEIEITDASSGLQSLSPLALTSSFFSSRQNDGDGRFREISVEQKRKIDSGKPESRVVNSRLINIVEEPEQNLYPASQAEVLYYLLKTLECSDNSLLITTHSPYLLSYLTLAAKSAELVSKGVSSERVAAVAHTDSFIAPGRISIYETADDGTIHLVEPYESLPGDDNSLNRALSDTNEIFASLMELEEELS